MVPKPPFDPDEMFPPDKYELIKDVPLIDAHEATNSRSGKRINIDDEYLLDIAKNGNKRFDETGDATPFVLKHTHNIPGKDDPEIVGYFVRFKVEKFLNTDRKATCADLYLMRDKKEEVKKYPRRSIELWTSRRSIDPVAALGADSPERDLGLLLLARTEDETPYRYSLEVLMDDPKAVEQATSSQLMESQPYREIVTKVEGFAADLLAMKQQQEQCMQALSAIQQIMDALADEYEQGDEQGGGGAGGNPHDLLGPADESQQAGAGAQPVQMQAAGPNSGYIPSTDTEKEQMSNTNEDDKVKFQRAVEEEVTKRTKDMNKAIGELQKAKEEYAMKFARAEAEQIVNKLEQDDKVDFGETEDREWHVTMFANLDNKSREVLIEKTKKHYAKKIPNGGKAVESVQYQRTEVDLNKGLKSIDDVLKLVDENLKTGTSYEDYMKKLTNGVPVK